MQASSTKPTVAQQRTIEQLRVKLRVDLVSLNTLLAGSFADLQRRTDGVRGALPSVVPP